jgi:hypothetical protein
MEGTKQEEPGEYGYVRNCLLVARKGEVLFWDGKPTLDGYAIIPMEEYEEYERLRDAITQTGA